MQEAEHDETVTGEDGAVLQHGKTLAEKVASMPGWIHDYLRKEPAPRPCPWLKEGVSLYYYQEAALDRMDGPNKNTILAMEMGTGKTNTILSKFAAVIFGDDITEKCTYPQPREDRKCLFICPPNLIENCLASIVKYFKKNTFRTLVVDDKTKADVLKNGVLFRKRLVGPVTRGGANLVIISDRWLVSVANHARTTLAARGIVPSAKTMADYSRAKNRNSLVMHLQYGGQRIPINTDRDMEILKKESQHSITNGGHVDYISHLEPGLWRRILDGELRTEGAKNYALKKVQKWAILGEVEWACMAFDEAHRFNNEGTKLLATMSLIKAPLKIYATGTPVENSDKDLRTLLISLGCKRDDVRDASRWKNHVSARVMNDNLRKIIDQHLLYLPKCVIEENYCESALSTHVMAKRLNLAVPTNTLREPIIETKRLPVATHEEVRACNYVLNELQSHMPRWVEEAKARAAKRASSRGRKMLAKRLYSRHSKAQKDGEKDSDESDEERPSMTAVFDQETTVVSHGGASLRSKKLTPLEGVRQMRNLCFSPSSADPIVILESFHLDYLIAKECRLCVKEETWGTDAEGNPTCKIVYSFSNNSKERREAIFPDLLLPKDILMPVREAGHSTKVREIIAQVLSHPKSWKSVIFVRYYFQIAILIKAFEEAMDGLRPMVLYGNTKMDMRACLIDQFKTDPEARVMIANPDVAGVGLDFSFANYASMPMPHYNPARDAQCQDRLNRLGRAVDAPPVHIDYLILADSLEESILKKRTVKTNIAQFLMGAVRERPCTDEENATAEEKRNTKTNAFLSAIRDTKAIKDTVVPASSMVHVVEESDSDYDDDEGLLYESDIIEEEEDDGDVSAEEFIFDWSADDNESHAATMDFLCGIGDETDLLDYDFD